MGQLGNITILLFLVIGLQWFICESFDQIIDPEDLERCFLDQGSVLSEEIRTSLKCMAQYQGVYGKLNAKGCRLVQKGKIPCGDNVYYQHLAKCLLNFQETWTQLLNELKNDCVDVVPMPDIYNNFYPRTKPA